MDTLLIFIVLLFFIMFGVPIALSLGLAAIIVMYWMGGTDLLIMMAQRMYSSTTSFPLLAIPFFIFAGNIMNIGGMTWRIFGFAQLVVGRIPGGLGHVNVLASMLFAGMSGSAVADAAGLGVVEIQAMRKAGYDEKFAASITAASSTIGPILPPSIPFVIYGSLANVSIGMLFLGGIIPGVLMGLALMFVISIVAIRMHLPLGCRVSGIGEVLRIVVSALPALFMPAIIVGGILGGIFTPTEAAVVATLYALFLGSVVYRELSLRAVIDLIWITARQTIQVMFIISCAGAFGWVIIQQQIPVAIMNGILGMTSTPWIVLLLVNIILIVLGMFLESIAVMIIVYPIFLPLMETIGVSPIHFGVIMVLNLMIGLVTPPVGLCLYAVSSVSNVSVGEIVRGIWPFVLVLFGVLAVVTYVPEVVMWLPNMVGGV